VKKLFPSIEPYVYLTPTLTGLLLFSAGAVVASFFMSFTRWEIISPPQWIGITNYRTMFESDLFWQVFGNTFYYTILSVPLSLALSLGLALLVHERVKGITFFRTTYFLPVVSSTVAVAIVWSWLYHPEVGLINLCLKKILRVDGPQWLADTAWAMPAMVFMSVWKGLGYNMVIFLAGLQNISEDYYEAARIDGAPAWRRFLNITLPMLSPTTFFVLVINLIGSFQVFEQTYILTKGGPANATLTLSYYIFQNAFQFFKMGYAAAMAYVLFAVILVVTLAQFRLQRRWVFYG
jgi:multiple sugar transport system permease protein